MEFSFLDFLTLVGSLGIFLFGMKMMSEALQKAAGNRLRTILGDDK
jgi:phosphate:Na+ symporter